jgi:hypothetical protein
MADFVGGNGGHGAGNVRVLGGASLVQTNQCAEGLAHAALHRVFGGHFL